MLYPQKLNRKKGDLLIKIFIGISIILAIILVLINHFVTPDVQWAGLANAGIIYIWITVIYSISRNSNIATHVLFQAIAISVLTFYIDYKTGFRGWSINISIPIIIMIANITMLILTIVSYKRYIRYAICQLVICLLSLLPLFFIYEHLVVNKTLSYIATGICFVNFLLTICLSAKEVKDAVSRNFHI